MKTLSTPVKWAIGLGIAGTIVGAIYLIKKPRASASQALIGPDGFGEAASTAQSIAAIASDRARRLQSASARVTEATGARDWRSLALARGLYQAASNSREVEARVEAQIAPTQLALAEARNLSPADASRTGAVSSLQSALRGLQRAQRELRTAIRRSIEKSHEALSSSEHQRGQEPVDSQRRMGQELRATLPRRLRARFDSFWREMSPTQRQTFFGLLSGSIPLPEGASAINLEAIVEAWNPPGP